MPDGTFRFEWVGRLVDWKHPDAAVRVVRRLIKEGHKVSLTMLGTGPMKEELQALAQDYEINMVGGVPFQQVRDYLHQADVYLFTSDYGEGWGCVLNEAMAEGVATVSSVQAGATTFLIRDSENGLVYDGSEESLYRAALRYVQHPEQIKSMGMAGRNTIESVWNADVAAENLLCQFERIRLGERPERTDGPCGCYTGEYV